MKSILKILVLGAVPVLAVTMVANPALAADKGSQLIFQSNMAHKNFISVTNTADSKRAVTVLTQYYNDEMKRVLWYLRVIPSEGTVLVDPFDHMIPGTATDDDPDGTNVSEILGALPAMSTDKEAGTNSGHFVIAVTAVGANYSNDDDDDGTVSEAEMNARNTVNVLFPTFLAKDMHGTDNIDNCGMFIRVADDGDPDTPDNPLVYSNLGTDGVNDCRKADADASPPVDADGTSKNVGDLSVGKAEPIAFNHLTGHFTEALLSTAAGGADQTASWGGTPVIRPAVDDTDNAMAIVDDYWTLTGADADAIEGGGRLAEKDAGGAGTTITNTGARTAYTAPSDIAEEDDDATNRAIGAGGALVLPALHGGGGETKQIMLMLSAADEIGGPGKYELIAAKTGYKIVLMDNMGDALPDPAAESGPIFGGVDAPDAPAGVNIIVDGIRVMTNADLAKCTGTAIMGPWMLDHLTSLVPTASSGAKDFAGLDAMMMGSMNASPGWIKFMRTDLTCKENYGDGDAPESPIEDNDGVPTKEERTYKAGTLVVEQKDSTRAFVTTGRALLKFITAESTFAASWSLKSPASTADN